MARYSAAYSDWSRRRSEVETIIGMAERIARMPPRPRNLARSNALCRSGIVLLCSHLEGYIEALGNLAIDRISTRSLRKDALPLRFRYHLSRDLVDVIGDGTDPDSKATRIANFIGRDLYIWDQTETFSGALRADNIVGRFMTPNHHNIGRFFRRFGYERFDGELKSVLEGRHPVCLNAINNLVSERNKIAHGDHLAIGTPTDLAFLYEQTKLYCQTVDTIVGNWFSGLGCSIR